MCILSCQASSVCGASPPTLTDLSVSSANTKHSSSSLFPQRSDTTRAMDPPWQLPQNPAMSHGCSFPRAAHLSAGVPALWGRFCTFPLLCPSVHAGAEVVRGRSQLHQAGGEQTTAATTGAKLPPWNSNRESQEPGQLPRETGTEALC